MTGAGLTWQTRARQAATIARLEIRRVFWSKRSFWVYLLALFPAVVFIGHGVEVKMRHQRNLSRDLISPETADRFHTGMTPDQVLEIAPKPQRDNSWNWTRHDDETDKRIRETRRVLSYYDGKRRVDLSFRNGKMESIQREPLLNFEEDRMVFAGMFQYFYLRLGIFFGCLGIFLNLFRGEIMDKTLHFWMLVPARREVLMFGKYLAGLTAAAVIFGLGTVLCFGAMLWPQDPAQVQLFWNNEGPWQLGSYLLAAVLGCVGYGAVFLAAGLFFRNPIVPAIVLQIWESISGFLPEMLQKVSVLYYLQSVCPVPAPTEKDMPAVLKMILSPAAPASGWVAVLGLLVLTAVVLFGAAQAIRRLEINYSTE